jgi:hypothetical protein
MRVNPANQYGWVVAERIAKSTADPVADAETEKLPRLAFTMVWDRETFPW